MQSIPKIWKWIRWKVVSSRAIVLGHKDWGIESKYTTSVVTKAKQGLIVLEQFQLK